MTNAVPTLYDDHELAELPEGVQSEEYIVSEDESSEDEAGVGAGIGFLEHAADVGNCCPCL